MSQTTDSLEEEIPEVRFDFLYRKEFPRCSYRVPFVIKTQSSHIPYIGFEAYKLTKKARRVVLYSPYIFSNSLNEWCRIHGNDYSNEYGIQAGKEIANVLDLNYVNIGMNNTGSGYKSYLYKTSPTNNMIQIVFRTNKISNTSVPDIHKFRDKSKSYRDLPSIIVEVKNDKQILRFTKISERKYDEWLKSNDFYEYKQSLILSGLESLKDIKTITKLDNLELFDETLNDLLQELEMNDSIKDKFKECLTTMNRNNNDLQDYKPEKSTSLSDTEKNVIAVV